MECHRKAVLICNKLLFCIVFTEVYIWATKNLLWPRNLGARRPVGPVLNDRW